MAEAMLAVSLRIEHPTIRHETIAQVLGLEPAFGYSIGEPRRTPKGRLLEGSNKRTYCCFELASRQVGDVAEVIEKLFPRLGLHASYFQELTQGGGRVELFVGFFIEEIGGFTLPVVDLAELARLSLEFSLEVYH